MKIFHKLIVNVQLSILTSTCCDEQKKGNVVDYIWKSYKQNNQDDGKLKKMQLSLHLADILVFSFYL